MLFKFIDNFLNKITMYKLTLYGLIVIWVTAIILSIFHVLSYSPFDIVFSLTVILVACLGINRASAWAFKAPSNEESVYITAFILALIISPTSPLNHLWFLLVASVIAMASKYILAIGKKHLFNPAAIAMVITAFGLNFYAGWWIGTLYLAPVVFICGFLITRKLQRWDLVLSFFTASAILVLGRAFFTHNDVLFIGRQLVIESPWMFLAFIMLTEPATTPPTRHLRIIYGSLVGFLFFLEPLVPFYFGPELVLVLGNIFSYIVSPKEKLILTLQKKLTIAHNTFDFIFTPDKKMHFKPGQYLEWTLAHKNHDNRGMRRYFTIASSPTEDDVRIGVKFYDKPSSYKKALESLSIGDHIVASQLAGDFTLPKDKNIKLVFIAGGIGVTPFRSMIKYLLDQQEKRDVVFLYASGDGFAYEDVFNQAQQNLGVNVAYVSGFMTKELITENAPDFKDRIFYISGPRSMIISFEKTLSQMGVPRHNIKTDFFPWICLTFMLRIVILI